MRKLKPYERELLVLSKIDCLKYKEIADILNITESNVKIRIFRALKRLKDFYEKLEKTRYEKARAKEKTI
jgi:RNA polymerase sigma factor (sigma-70 family)